MMYGIKDSHDASILNKDSEDKEKIIFLVINLTFFFFFCVVLQWVIAIQMWLKQEQSKWSFSTPTLASYMTIWSCMLNVSKPLFLKSSLCATLSTQGRPVSSFSDSSYRPVWPKGMLNHPIEQIGSYCIFVNRRATYSILCTSLVM